MVGRNGVILVLLLVAIFLLTVGVVDLARRPAWGEVAAGLGVLLLARVYAEITRRG